MKILAADDELLQLNQLERAISEAIPGAEIVSFSQPSKLIEWIENDGQADVAFLDVEMGSMTGIQIAEKLLEVKPQQNIIFVTGHTHYAADAFQLHASGYVTKPVTAEKIRNEMKMLRFDVTNIFARTFGDFDLFVDGVAVMFKRSKSKEMLAYLVYKSGGMVNRKEIAAVLFEDDYSAKTQNYIAKIYADLVKDLQAVGIERILRKGFNQYGVDTTTFSCDLYDYEAKDPRALSAYKGEFMAQYEWADFL